MKIGKFRNKDAEKLSLLILETIDEVVSKTYKKKHIDFYKEYYSPKKLIWYSKKYPTFVAVERKKIIGTISLDKNRVHTLFVKHNSHGKGIGKKLVSHAESLAKKKGYKKIKLRAFLNAEKFYRKLGYKGKKMHKLIKGEKFAMINMSKKL